MSQSIMLLNQTHIHLPFKILKSGRWLVGNSNTFSVEQLWEILSQVGHAAKQVQIGRNLSGHPWHHRAHFCSTSASWSLSPFICLPGYQQKGSQPFWPSIPVLDNLLMFNPVPFAPTDPDVFA